MHILVIIKKNLTVIDLEADQIREDLKIPLKPERHTRRQEIFGCEL